jgi:hypothetical protein
MYLSDPSIAINENKIEKMTSGIKPNQFSMADKENKYESVGIGTQMCICVV